MPSHDSSPVFCFSGQRQQRARGVDFRALQLQKQGARPFPMLEEPRKKTKISDQASVVLADDYDFVDEDAIRFISPDMDPKRLCPYCDGLLLEEPTAKLTQLLEETFCRSYSDPRPSNPLGRKAGMAIFAVLCQRHVFENKTMSQAISKGWPTSINWDTLKDRVVAMKGDLMDILTDPGRPIIYKNAASVQQSISLEELRAAGGAWMQCIFWREMLVELESKGSRIVSGVGGWFTTFEKMQPGYYGELGAVIIHQTLYDMFPSNTTQTSAIQPLELREFISYILVPEVGMCLIMQDLALDVNNPTEKTQGVVVMRDSASYGASMFPEDGVFE
ncbi:RTC4-like domain-containing protein [Mycena capillaripes]|nr:RTC4-like domain-containing protein [Mycena capillaripes]